MKIAIAGFGLEGKANFTYWNTPGNEVVIVDERNDLDAVPDGAKTMLGQDIFGSLDGYDMVVRTASLPPRKIKTDGKIWSATNEFFAKCPAPIIGVTGTKGKGTTSSMIVSILQAAGRKTHLVGNIGTPALEVLPSIQADDIVVFELSSFQLWDIERSPHVAVILPIEPDHLNVHEHMDDYISAKANITKYQTDRDVLVFNKNNEISSRIAKNARAKKIPYPFDMIEFASSLVIPGEHNVENASAAIAAIGEYVQDKDVIRQGLRAFKGLPHRLELVRELEGVKYYNDSFSSAPSATVAAIRSFKNPEILILGGTDKGGDFTELAEALKARNTIKQLVIIGEIRQKLADFLHSHGVVTAMDISNAKTMTAIVALARGYAEHGDTVILSPACASFDMFKNFADRGDQFREAVKAL